MTVAANVVATGRYLPERLVTNDELRQQFAGHERADVIDRFEANSGILQRYWAHPEQTTSDLALEAARQALARAGRQAAELDQLASQKMQISRLNVDKTTLGGAIQLSFQDRDWTDPAIMSLLVNDMASAYANQCEAHICNTLVANTSSTTIPLAAESSATSADWIKAISAAQEHISKSIFEMANTIYLSTDMYRQLVSLCDNTGRPIFSTVEPRNAPGRTDGVVGGYLEVQDMQAVMSWQLPAGTCIVGHYEALESFEQLGGQVSVVQPNVLGMELAFYGYWADLVTVKDAFVPIVQASSSGRK
jgi:hypothetical protein